jgi:hypothetical protein
VHPGHVPHKEDGVEGVAVVVVVVVVPKRIVVVVVVAAVVVVVVVVGLHCVLSQKPATGPQFSAPS